MSRLARYRTLFTIVASYSALVGTHRPESDAQPTVLAVHGQHFERLKPDPPQGDQKPKKNDDDNPPPQDDQEAKKGNEQDKESKTAETPTQDADFPAIYARGGVMKFQDFHDDGIVVNHIKAKEYSSPKEMLMGQTASFMMLGFTIFISLVLYTVNFPDPQVENYGNKLVSTSMSIYCAVLVEKIFHAFLAPCIVEPFAKALKYTHSDLGYDMVKLTFTSLIFVGWFCSLSVLCYSYRQSKQTLYAIQSFVAHIVAFMAIFSFGYFEKKACSRCKTYDNGAMCYVWFPFCVFVFIWLLGFLGKMIRTKLDPSLADAHSSGHHADSRHSWSSVAEEAESDARAIAVSFLCRQCSLFLITGRIPSIRGDTEPHSLGEWHFLYVCVGITALFLVLSTFVKEKFQWSGDEGALGQGMHVSQTLLAMIFGWLLLTVVHWIAQNYMKYSACWNLLTAFGVTPLAFGAIIVVDRLSDYGIVGRASELVMLNSLGITLGFAWEQAFGSGIDTVTVTFKKGFAFECALCIVMIIFVLPAWRLYIVPKAFLPIPPRVGPPGTRVENASKPSDSASGGRLGLASNLATIAETMPDTD